MNYVANISSKTEDEAFADVPALVGGGLPFIKVEIGNAVFYLGDATEVLPHLSDLDSIVADGPYGLSFMGKAWDYEVPKAEFWSLALGALKPGGHMVNFASARTYHRMAVEVEDAGFDIRDQLMWLYGSGFPKSHDVSKAIDKTLGAKRDIVGQHSVLGFNTSRVQNGMQKNATFDRTSDKAATGDAEQWQGWGTALKPAHEPIVLARKPFGGSVATNVLANGTGALNIDACRVPSFDDNPSIFRRQGSTNHLSARSAKETEAHGKLVSRQSPEAYRAPRKGEKLGRWPANVVHDGSDVVLAEFPMVRTGRGSKYQRGLNAIYSHRRIEAGAEVSANGGDDGNAARFFDRAKASTKEREAGLEGFAKRQTAFFQTANGASGEPSSIEPDKGTTKPRANIHPTVKPIALMRWLCKLVTSPGGVVLDPFVGSGSTGVAALKEGFRFIGIERDPAYFEIACARIAEAQGLALDDVLHVAA